ncbi:hypothetical protein JAAARDRAFT_50737 [Jaapia argillacea MUCL 33604]|uniref:Uncharacterized protein n=1 Tax=Jaapia argillacea MUCL 33604 TaxID=933084 RepID=A0A067PKF9_9AGAM|nr:hypothetical protein JAAARDRAFT_50737 [Jaapia argillacea MUCL 33604]
MSSQFCRKGCVDELGKPPPSKGHQCLQRNKKQKTFHPTPVPVQDNVATPESTTHSNQSLSIPTSASLGWSGDRSGILDASFEFTGLFPFQYNTLIPSDPSNLVPVSHTTENQDLLGTGMAFEMDLGLPHPAEVMTGSISGGFAERMEVGPDFDLFLQSDTNVGVVESPSLGCSVSIVAAPGVCSSDPLEEISGLFPPPTSGGFSVGAASDVLHGALPPSTSITVSSLVLEEGGAIDGSLSSLLGAAASQSPDDLPDSAGFVDMFVSLLSRVSPVTPPVGDAVELSTVMQQFGGEELLALGEDELDIDSDDESVCADTQLKYIENDQLCTKRHSSRSKTLMKNGKDLFVVSQPYILIYIARPKSILLKKGVGKAYTSPILKEAMQDFGDANILAEIHEIAIKHARSQTMTMAQVQQVQEAKEQLQREAREAAEWLAEEKERSRRLQADLDAMRAKI